MTLEPQEVERFYRIWWPLLSYVNRVKGGLVKNWPESPKTGKVKPDAALKIRGALWADDAVREAFIAENPASLDGDDLAIVGSWKHRVAGNRVILRQLKKYAIVMDTGKNPRAYAVLGLMDPLEDVVPYPLPMYVGIVLLPFESRIIYDGLVTAMPVMLGAGIRSDLNAAFRDIQDSYGLIHSLPPDDSAQRAGIADGNKRLLKAFRAYLAGAGLSDKMVAQHTEAAAALARQMLQEKPPRPLLELDLMTARRYLTVHPSVATTLKRFARFLDEGARGDWDRVAGLQQLRQRAG
jgi:hypothetical protein